jgi:hypothetical protein
MKKELFVFLCLALLLSSCADLSMDKEEALKADLPKGFAWNIYAEINNDVAMSQIIFDIREKNKAYRQADETAADSTSNATDNCISILLNEGLLNEDFAEKIYSKYIGCPKKGWLQSERCEEKYANNNNYNKGTDTTGWQCVIGNCWNGGWDEISEREVACTGDIEEDLTARRTGCVPLKNFLQDSLKTYSGALRRNVKSDTTIRMMCMLVPKAEKIVEAENYLKDFYYYSSDGKIVYGQKFDSTLVEQHYHSFGRYDGRPYKYCEQGHIGVEKTQELADKLMSDNNRVTYYDYSKYLFCFNKDDQKIYVIN